MDVESRVFCSFDVQEFDGLFQKIYLSISEREGGRGGERQRERILQADPPPCGWAQSLM